MSIQQSFNQGLMGTTFLLGQMPVFKQAQESAADVSRFKKEGKVLNEARNLINKGAGNEAEAAKAVLAKQGQEFLAGFSTSNDPRLRTKAAIATSRLIRGNYDKRIASALEKREARIKQAQTPEDALDKINREHQNKMNSVQNLRGNLSNTQRKKLEYRIKKETEQNINEEMRARAYGESDE